MNTNTPPPDPEHRKAVDQGREDAEQLFPLFLMRMEDYENDHQLMILWWSGFFASASGHCSGQVGPGAIQAISNILTPMVETKTKEGGH